VNGVGELLAAFPALRVLVVGDVCLDRWCTYDPALDTVYWPTGNPTAEYNGDDRKGDNLYSDCVLALDAKTGKLKWYYQFTPHDLWDWDSTETSVMVNADWQGTRRQLMLHADRNGFFYVFDRSNGKLLLAKQFLRNPELHAWAVTDIDTPKDLKAILWREGGF